MCYLAVYHPETEKWERVEGKISPSFFCLAIVHEESPTKYETAQVAGGLAFPNQEQRTYYHSLGLDTQLYDGCESCREIRGLLPHISDRGSQRKDAWQYVGKLVSL